MQRTILIFGLIAGAIVSLTMLITMLIHKQNLSSFDDNMVIGYASMLLAASMIPVAIKSYRDRHQNGWISFKDAFLMGLGIALIASLLYVFTWVLIYKNIYPDFMQNYARASLEKMQAAGKPAIEIAQAKEEMQAMSAYYDTWWGLCGITFIEIFPILLIVALVSALVLKRVTKEVRT
jgi:hypothetical protein